jgi:hypothetical protein
MENDQTKAKSPGFEKVAKPHRCNDRLEDFVSVRWLYKFCKQSFLRQALALGLKTTYAPCRPL